MSDSASWRDLAEQFEKLDSESRLRVEWVYYISLKVYRFEVRGETALFKAKFDLLTVHAGQRIDPSDPKDTWLTLVKRNSPDDTFRSGTVIEEGAEETPVIRGVTERPCQISATLCHTFAAQALENEGPISPQLAMSSRAQEEQGGIDHESGLSPARRKATEETNGVVSVPEFPKRAAWLSDRLRERSWNKHDVSRQRGPDHKTVQKILDGKQVRADILAKLTEALSRAPVTNHLPNPIVTVLQIPKN